MADEATQIHLDQARQELASYRQQLANQDSEIATLTAARDLSAAQVSSLESLIATLEASLA